MNTHQAAAPGHADADAHDRGGFTLRTYLTGFVLAAILTAVPFWIVMTGAIPGAGTARAVVIAFAIAQIIVQTVTFLHVNARAQGGWTLLAYVFTAVLLVITIAGSIWIMYHLNANMMPGMMGDPTVSPAP